MRMTMIQADTGSFTFTAFGENRAEAMQALRRGWESHARLTGAEMTWDEVQENITRDLTVVQGHCYRDLDQEITGSIEPLPVVTLDDMFAELKGLLTEPPEQNPEYDRALYELTARCFPEAGRDTPSRVEYLRKLTGL